jgi:glutamate carboxypeptidase
MTMTFSALLTLTLVAGVAFTGSEGSGPSHGKGPGKPTATALSDQERAIVQHVETHSAEGVALLERAVNINSGTLNFTGVREVGRLFSAEFEKLGFKTAWIDGTAFKRAGHLVAEHQASGPRVLLIGHLDTVFETHSPFQRFERIGEGEAKGPGVLDMKGGDVIMIQALKALASVGALKSLNVTVVMTGDEESAGEPQSAAREALVAAAHGARVALGFEDGDGKPGHAVTGRRGTSSWTLKVKGTPAHSSQIFREDIGFGAVFEAARILNAFRETLASQEHLTFNPGLVLGGTQMDYDAPQSRGAAFGKENVIAEHAIVSGDLRALSKEQFENAQNAMKKIVAASLAHTTAEMTFEEGYPPLTPTEGNRQLLRMYDEASRDLGLGPVTEVNPDRAGAADVSFVAGEVPMILDGIGMRGDGGHTVNEIADLTMFPAQIKRTALLLYRLGRARD